MSTHSWHIAPRDPLVFDSGTRHGRPSSLLPPQPSLVGCIRGAYFEAAPRPANDNAAQSLARRLLDVEIRGPWLLHRATDNRTILDRLRVPCPADLLHAGDDHDPTPRIAARLRALGEAEGVHLPGPGRAPRYLLAPPADAGKVRDLANHVLSLRDAITFALDAEAASDRDPASLDGLTIGRPTAPEHRTHVSIKPDTLTAEPEQLFVSRGQRLLDEYELVLDVTAPPDLATPEDGILFLGGESRPSRLTLQPAPTWPAFADVRDQYDAAIRRHRGQPLALRLTLMTPGDFGDWRPPALTGPLDEPLTLLAACHGRHLAISGWDLRKRRPRPVRRLVPAGATYLYEVPPGVDLLALCKHFWARPLRSESTTTTHDQTLAPVQHDSYALALPGIRLLPSPPA